MTSLTADDARWLDAAARYAAPFAGTTADNPAVGALLVDPRSQTLIARAVTARGGRPHAEAEVIARAGFEAAGCTLYVTLEPCHHWGRSPPCVDAIIRAGIMRVVIGAADPDPRTAGKSLSILESAGIETVLADRPSCLALIAGHQLRRTRERPFVTAVMVVSADGMIGRHSQRRTPLAAESGAWLDVLRSRCDATLIGGATAVADDPDLAITLPGMPVRTPLRIVLAGHSGIGRNVNLIGGFSGHRTVIIAENDVPVDAPVSVEVIRLRGQGGRPDLASALKSLAERSVQNLLIQPGQRLAATLLEADLVDRFAIITQPGEMGTDGIPASADGPIADLLDAAGLAEVENQALGEDSLAIFERPLPAV